MKTYTAELHQNVNAGIKHLNREMPGWFLKIDLGKLDLISPDDCVSGQLGIRKYSPDLGFNLPYKLWNKYNHKQRKLWFGKLTTIWRTKIAQLRTDYYNKPITVRMTRAQMDKLGISKKYAKGN
jgi:hypothetical protein